MHTHILSHLQVHTQHTHMNTHAYLYNITITVMLLHLLTVALCFPPREKNRRRKKQSSWRAGRSAALKPLVPFTKQLDNTIYRSFHLIAASYSAIFPLSRYLSQSFSLALWHKNKFSTLTVIIFCLGYLLAPFISLTLPLSLALLPLFLHFHSHISHLSVHNGAP